MLIENCFPFQRPLADWGMVWGWYRRGKWESSLGSQEFPGLFQVSSGYFISTHPLGEVPSWLPSMFGSSITTKSLPPGLDSFLLPSANLPAFPTKSLLTTRCGFGSTCWSQRGNIFEHRKEGIQMCRWLAQWYWPSIYQTNGPTMCHAPARLWGWQWWTTRAYILSGDQWQRDI